MYLVWRDKASKELPQVALVLRKGSSIERSGGKIKLAIGLESKKKIRQRDIPRLIRQAVLLAKQNGLSGLSLKFDDFRIETAPLPPIELAELIARNLLAANFNFHAYVSSPSLKPLKRAEVVGRTSPEIKAAFRKGRVIGEALNQARVLANTPGGEMTPTLLAEAAKVAAANLPVKVTVLGRQEMAKLGMGGILGVAKGSAEEPKFIIMEYAGAEAARKRPGAKPAAGVGAHRPIVLVGKGVTFDTGGLNLKSSEHIYEMHMDMAGGAAVIQAVACAARLGLKRNVIGLIPAAENMPSGSSYRPGDILRSLSGQTIEVLNTDAEGRIILADALTFAERYKPSLVVDAATLTGAAMVALGQRASAIFTRDPTLEAKFRAWGEETGEYVWPLPLWEEYESEIKGTFGDWANVGKTNYGGAITGAVFLAQFAKKYPWVHLDIAPRMTAIKGDHLAEGATGSPLPLLMRALEKF